MTRLERGQAAVEYVGLVSVVAIALAVLALLAPRPAHQMLAIVERAICTGLGRDCEVGGEESLALEPCPVSRSTADTDVRATVFSVSAGSGRTALVEQLSDGRATVTLADRGGLGLEGGVGASFTSDGQGRGARAEGSVGIVLGAGRGYEFAGLEQALRFVEERRGAEADFTYLEGGGAVRLEAEEAAGSAHAGGRAAGAGVIGRRVDHRSGQSTSYRRLSGQAAAYLGAPVGATGGVEAEAVLEYTTAADGTPLSLTVRSTRSDAGRLGHAVHADAAGGGPAIRGADTRGDLVEQVASLDLGDRRNREAAAALVEALGPPVDPLALAVRGRAVERRLEDAGELEVRVFTTAVRESEVSGHAALGVKLGGTVASRASERTLTSAHTRPAGATVYLERTDCVG